MGVGCEEGSIHDDKLSRGQRWDTREPMTSHSDAARNDDKCCGNVV